MVGWRRRTGPASRKETMKSTLEIQERGPVFDFLFIYIADKYSFFIRREGNRICRFLIRDVFRHLFCNKRLFSVRLDTMNDGPIPLRHQYSYFPCIFALLGDNGEYPNRASYPPFPWAWVFLPLFWQCSERRGYTEEIWPWCYPISLWTEVRAS